MTAPTMGFGAVRPSARRASASQRRRKSESVAADGIEGDELVDAPLVASALEAGGAKREDDVLGQAGASDPLAEADDVGVVVLARHPRRVDVGHAGGTR